MPYAWAGPATGLRLVFLTALGTTRNGSQATFGLSAGGGLRLAVGGALLGIELGGGVRERGPEIVGRLSSGLHF